MPLPIEEIKRLIKEDIPDATIEIKDLMGDSNHYSATIKSSKFNNLNKIEQHKLVYKSLKGKRKIMEINDKIKKLINDNEVCLFMKGTPDSPQCGFSMAVSNVLKHLNVNFKGVNVLEDPNLRQGIKDYSDWPTIPQLYIKNEFIGGCDIVKEMFEKGELKKFLEEKKII